MKRNLYFSRETSGITYRDVVRFALNGGKGNAVGPEADGAQTVDFGAVSGGSCAELTMSLNGAALGDSVAAGWPESLPAGTAGTMFVSLANVVTIRLCNVTSTAINPVNANFRATIIRSF